MAGLCICEYASASEKQNAATSRKITWRSSLRKHDAQTDFLSQIFYGEGTEKRTQVATFLKETLFKVKHGNRDGENTGADLLFSTVFIQNSAVRLLFV